jgi:hypothetical protein
VIPVLFGNVVGNFFMAVHASEGRRARAKLMAGVALCRPGQGSVCFRERTRRNLRKYRPCAKEASDKRQKTGGRSYSFSCLSQLAIARRA